MTWKWKWPGFSCPSWDLGRSGDFGPREPCAGPAWKAEPTKDAYGLGKLQMLQGLGRMRQAVARPTPCQLLDWSSHIGRSSPERTALGNVILGTCVAQRHHWPGCTGPSDMAVRCRPPSPFHGKSTPGPRYSICVTCSTNLKRVVRRKNWAGVASGRCFLSKKGNCT